MFDREELQAIKTFPSLVKYLRDELDWPIETDDFDDLTFDYKPEELGIDPKTAAKIEQIKQLRPLVSNQPWGIFFIKFEPKRLPVVVLRRILRTLVIKKRASASKSHQATWNLHDLLFISSYGESDHRDITFAHFTEDDQAGDLPALRVLGWDDEDTVLHLEHAHQVLREKLRWPSDPHQADEWSEQWSSAFTLKHREVIITSKDLAVQLAHLATAIRKRVSKVLIIETESGPLHRLMESFKKALIHDLYEEAFADMYAQTITYGLLSARVSRPEALVAENITDMVPATNPFLKDLLSTFLAVGGRKGKIDFDELGINEVVHALRDANMEAILRDFGDRNPQEDPVIHFYELFLKEYNPKLRMQRGVFYTPRPVVSFIVRSVDEILRTEFGLEDGLADITTWGEMLKRYPEMKLPKDTKSEEPFVQILDPALGTGTFLVEVIDIIHKTMKTKWNNAGFSNSKQEQLWNEYVPKHLLPRLYGFELLMAPYAIAHMKIGLKLSETGYRFASDERARIYLTNALEPPKDFSDQLVFMAPELAHEAQAVNEIKRHQRFTIVIGNPPYSIQSGNLSDEARALVESYKWADGERIRERNALQFEKNIQDDYVKFVRLAESALETSDRGVFGIICNSSFLDSRSFRGMRRHLLLSMAALRILDLHGSGKKSETSGDHDERDENVFDIQQGVSITFATRHGRSDEARVEHSDVRGDRGVKSAFLLHNTMRTSGMVEIYPKALFYLLVPATGSSQEYDNGISLRDLFKRFSSGVKTHRDAFAYAFASAEMDARIQSFKDQAVSDQDLRQKYGLKDGPLWQLRKARRALTNQPKRLTIVQADYRPFDKRWLAYSDEIVRYTARPTMRHMVDARNVALLVCQQQVERGFRHALVTRTVADCCSVSGKSRETTSLFPAYISDPGDTLFESEGDSQMTNISEKGANVLASIRGLRDPSPELILAYIYSLLYSPTYRKRYVDSLRNDFPRVLIPKSADLFTSLGAIGSELVAIHLMESSKLKDFITTFRGLENPVVGRVGWSNDTVWLDAGKTSAREGRISTVPGSIGFKGVPKEVWNFHIGGYQVCEKWLKDRKGRTLSDEDITHYHRIVVSLSETIRLMGEIDKAIEEHGGWPGAFVTAQNG